MKTRTIQIATIVAAALVTASCTTMSDTMSKAKSMVTGEDKMMAKDKMPFSGPGSVAYAGKLWSALSAAGMVGPNMKKTAAYKGQHPHGAVLMNTDGQLTVGGHTGAVIVKSNFGGEGVSIGAVNANPSKFLGAFTVMYKREAGYDADNQDWFWAKFKPDGSLDKNPAGMQLAGRVAKGKPMGCIACHTAAPGGDMVFTSDKYK